MSDKKQVGQVYEKRGDDTFTVYQSKDGQVLEVEQYDSRAAYNHWLSINFFAETAPGLIALIAKAAGLPAKESVEYEYALKMGDWGSGEPYILGRHWTSSGEYWGTKEDRQSALDWCTKEFPTSKFWMVKRRKAGKEEDV